MPSYFPISKANIYVQGYDVTFLQCPCLAVIGSWAFEEEFLHCLWVYIAL